MYLVQSRVQIWSFIKRGILMQLFLVESFIFCCEIHGTNVQIERTRKDLPKAYLKYRTEDIAHCFLMNKLFERIQI